VLGGACACMRASSQVQGVLPPLKYKGYYLPPLSTGVLPPDAQQHLGRLGGTAMFRKEWGRNVGRCWDLAAWVLALFYRRPGLLMGGHSSGMLRPRTLGGHQRPPMVAAVRHIAPQMFLLPSTHPASHTTPGACGSAGLLERRAVLGGLAHICGCAALRPNRLLPCPCTPSWPADWMAPAGAVCACVWGVGMHNQHPQACTPTSRWPAYATVLHLHRHCACRCDTGGAPRTPAFCTLLLRRPEGQLC
jgi:hypothetical protein